MTEFVYTDYFDDPTSEVIDRVWYDSDSSRLMVGLKTTDDLCGYENVSNLTFAEFRDAASRGGFWNRHIKRFYPGFNTEDIETFRKADEIVEPVVETVSSKPFAVRIAVNGVLEFSVTGLDALDAIRTAMDALSANGLHGDVVSVNPVETK